jgi:hypothetical protein
MKNPNTTTPNLSIHNNQVPKNNPTTPIYQSQYTNYPPLTNSFDPISSEILKKKKPTPGLRERKPSKQIQELGLLFSYSRARVTPAATVPTTAATRKMRITRSRERHVLSLLARERRKMG